jgi:hypothetical protein
MLQKILLFQFQKFKNFQKPLFITFCLISSLAVGCTKNENIFSSCSNAQQKELKTLLDENIREIKSTESKILKIKELTKFAWNKLYIFTPYT